MLTASKSSKRPKKYTPRARIIAHIRNEVSERLLRGAWKPGMLLPSRRAMAEEFHVNPITVQRALAPLIEESLLISDGRGTFVSDAINDMKDATTFGPNGRANETPLGIPSLMLNTLVVVSSAPSGHVSHRHAPGWMQVIDEGVTTAVRQHGLHIMTLSPTTVLPREWDYIIRIRPIGVVVEEMCDLQCETAKRLAACREQGVPVALFGDMSGRLLCDSVVSDHTDGSRQLTEWLLSRGYHRILLLLPAFAAGGWAIDRRIGYEQALSDAGINCPQVVELPDVRLLGSWETVFHDTTRLYAGYIAPYILADQPPDAIMAPSDGDIPAIAAACRILRKQPNLDIAIAGYDNYWSDIEEEVGESAIPLATVDKRNFEIGQELVRLVLARAAGELAAEPVRSVIAPQLIITNAVPPRLDYNTREAPVRRLQSDW